MDKAIKIALENNKSNKISKLALQIAQAQYKQALSANYPVISALLLGQRRDNDPIFEQKAILNLDSKYTKILAFADSFKIKDETQRTALQEQFRNTSDEQFPDTPIDASMDIKLQGRDTVRGILNLKYPIFTGGKIDSIINQAKLNKLIALNTIKRSENQVIFETKKYFYGYVITNELYKLMKSFHSRMKYLEELTKDFYENGESLTVKKTDYLTMKVTVSLIKSFLSKVKTNRELLQSALINALGLPWDSKIKAVYKKKLFPVNYTLARLVQRAYKNNLDIRKMDIALKISDEKIREEQSAHYPTLGFEANLMKTYNSYEHGVLNENQSNSWNIGFAANIPLFDGFRTTNKVNEKKIEKKKMYLLRDMIKEGIALQIKNELIKAYEGFSQIKTLKKAKKTAKNNRVLNSKAYAIGMIESKEVIRSQYLEMYVKGAYLQSLHEYLISLAKIDSLVKEGLK
ncbi:MAG: TolC family protein [Arcobacter sp.]|nr:TolC family protein [Arcobacter sp.]